MIVVHVDDALFVSDGSEAMDKKIQEVYRAFPFGTWKCLKDGPETYTGKRIRINECGEIELDMQEFIEGRTELIDLSECKGMSDETPVSPLQHAEFRSAVGCLHWAASQCRMDLSYEVNRLQKKQ
eukprot:6438345-Amphidinium_carterae.1